MLCGFWNCDETFPIHCRKSDKNTSKNEMKRQVMYSYVSATSPSASRSIALRDPQALLYLVDLCREALKGFCLFRLSTLWLLLCVKVIAERRFNKSQRERKRNAFVLFESSVLLPYSSPKAALFAFVSPRSFSAFLLLETPTINNNKQESSVVASRFSHHHHRAAAFVEERAKGGCARSFTLTFH